MSKLDEELIDRLRKAQKPISVNPRMLTQLAKRKERRERVKRVATLVSVLAVAGLGASGLFLANRGHSSAPASKGTSSAVAPDAGSVGAPIPGVPFPACHVTSLPFYDATAHSIYMFTRGSKGSPCPDIAKGDAYMAVYGTDIISERAEPKLVGPIECFVGCRVFGAPDIDGDGRAEIAVVVADRAGVDAIELYRLHPNARQPFTRITEITNGERIPLNFDWGGGLSAYRAGAYCFSGSKGTGDELVAWHASKRAGEWHLVQRFMKIEGSLARLNHVERSSAVGAEGFLPDGGGTDFCGASVTV